MHATAIGLDLEKQHVLLDGDTCSKVAFGRSQEEPGGAMKSQEEPGRSKRAMVKGRGSMIWAHTGAIKEEPGFRRRSQEAVLLLAPGSWFLLVCFDILGDIWGYSGFP